MRDAWHAFATCRRHGCNAERINMKQIYLLTQLLMLSGCVYEDTTESKHETSTGTNYVPCEYSCKQFGGCLKQDWCTCTLLDYGNGAEGCFETVSGNQMIPQECCIPRSTNDCATSDACGESGKCGHDPTNNTCIPVRDSDCQNSYFCTIIERCDCCLDWITNYCCIASDTAPRCSE